MSADSLSLTDVGPATPAPGWCLNNVEPQWDRLTERFGGGMVCTWSRKISDNVWIEVEDRIIGGRVMRTAPRIQYWESPAEGITVVAARELAEALNAAADIIARAAFGEAPR